MFCTGRFLVDGLDYAIMYCRISIPGPKTDEIGTVLAPPPAPRFTIKVESRKDTHLLRWIHEMKIKDHVKIVFYTVGDNGIGRTFNLYDVRCVSNYENFGRDGEVPMENTLILIPGILVADGVLLRVQNWKIQNPDIIMGKVKPKVIERTVTEEEVDEYLDEVYMLDKNNQKIKKVKEPQHVTLVLKTQGKVGKTVKRIKLNNQEYDYKYKNEVLAGGILTNIDITTDEERIPLEVIEKINPN